MNDITGVVLVLFLEMIQDSDLFLGLPVEPLLISHLDIGLYSTLYIACVLWLYAGNLRVSLLGCIHLRIFKFKKLENKKNVKKPHKVIFLILVSTELLDPIQETKFLILGFITIIYFKFRTPCKPKGIEVFVYNVQCTSNTVACTL